MSRESFREAIKAYLLLKIGDVDKAIVASQKAIRMNPNDAQAHKMLGRAYLTKSARDMVDKGISPSEAIRISPSTDMFDKGISELREATRIRPDDAEAHSYLGLAYFEKGDLDKFTTELQEAVRIQPRDFLAHFGLGMNYYVEGDFSQANTEFQEAMRINPELSRIVDGFNPMIRAFRDFYESFTGS